MKVEVLGVERRRRWRDDEKLRIVAETLEPNARITECNVMLLDH
jgi:transposase